MARLVYSVLCSLDGYIEDETGDFSWAAPDEEVHAFVNEQAAGIGTMLLGRRMYETLKAWETMDVEGEPDVIAGFKEIWLGADKIVYSRTLEEVETERTEIARSFDADAVRAMADGAERDVSIAGPELAAEALRGGIVDRVEMVLSPVVVGSGKAALPAGLKLQLQLDEERRFANGAVFLEYAVR